MPNQMFRFQCLLSLTRVLLIGASDEVEARGMLDAYLKKHQLLPSIANWRLKEVCGKVGYGIFTLSGI